MNNQEQGEHMRYPNVENTLVIQLIQFKLGYTLADNTCGSNMYCGRKRSARTSKISAKTWKRMVPVHMFFV